MREINVSRARDPFHAGDKALTRETPAKRRRVNRYGLEQAQTCGWVKSISEILHSSYIDLLWQNNFFF